MNKLDIKIYEKVSILKTKFIGNCDVIFSVGYLKKIESEIIENYEIINLHPSLLPKYKGLHTFKRAIKNKDFFCGCTIHYVDEKMDNGRIILKKRVNIDEDDEVKTLQKKVQSLEYKAYSMAIRKIYIKN